MIARGQIHSSGPKLAAYLTTGKEGERAELVELRGVAAEDIRGAFADLQNIAAALTHAEKPFFHAHIRLPDDERLTREQWLLVADRMEKVLGFENQARAVAFHRSDAHGDHLHVAWNRIDLDTLKAIDPGLFALKMRDEARKLEAELGLRRLSNEPRRDRLTKAAKQGEFEQAKRLDTDLDAIRNGIRQAWDGSDNGPSLAAALEAQGLILARGDRRDFVVIDAAGGEHALGKRVCGVTAGEVKQRLGGEAFKRGLPSVAEARATQRARRRTRARRPRPAGRRRSHVPRAATPRERRRRSPAQAGRRGSVGPRHRGDAGRRHGRAAARSDAGTGQTPMVGAVQAEAPAGSAGAERARPRPGRRPTANAGKVAGDRAGQRGSRRTEARLTGAQRSRCAAAPYLHQATAERNVWGRAFHAQPASGAWSGGGSHGAVSPARLAALMVAAQARHVARRSARIAQAHPFGGRDPLAALKGLAALLMQRPPKKKRERGRDENGLPLWWPFRPPREEEEIENEGPALQNVKWWLLEPHEWLVPEPG